MNYEVELLSEAKVMQLFEIEENHFNDIIIVSYALRCLRSGGRRQGLGRHS